MSEEPSEMLRLGGIVPGRPQPADGVTQLWQQSESRILNQERLTEGRGRIEVLPLCCSVLRPHNDWGTTFTSITYYIFLYCHEYHIGTHLSSMLQMLPSVY